ncbi:MAG: TlpA disulfide reductase family protein [candidate division FCPU426 bacterium]
MKKYTPILVAMLLATTLKVAMAAEAPVAVSATAAPSFKLIDLQGETWTEKGHKGVPLLIDFWASWCTPCLKEIPALNALHLRYKQKDQLHILGVNMDSGAGKAKAAISKYYIGYPVVLGNPEMGKAYGVQFPMAVLIKDGVIVKRLVGERTLKGFEKELKPFLR